VYSVVKEQRRFDPSLVPTEKPESYTHLEKKFREKEKALSAIDRKGLSAFALIHYLQEVKVTSWRAEASPAAHVPNLSTWNFRRIL
jgi:hypothetical protein